MRLINLPPIGVPLALSLTLRRRTPPKNSGRLPMKRRLIGCLHRVTSLIPSLESAVLPSLACRMLSAPTAISIGDWPTCSVLPVLAELVFLDLTRLACHSHICRRGERSEHSRVNRCPTLMSPF